MKTAKLDRLKTLVSDGWGNILGGQGTTRDRRNKNAVNAVSPSTDLQKWEDLYAGDDMAAKMIDVPVEDMIREWFSVPVDVSDDDTRGVDVKEAAQVSDDLLQFLDDLGAKRALVEGLTWGRVFGGSAMLLGAIDGNSDLTQPLNEDGITSLDYLEVIDRREVEIDSSYNDPAEPAKFGQTKTYRLISTGGVRGDAIQPPRVVHESRVVVFGGAMTNKSRKRRNGGWDDSVYVRVEEVLGDFGITWASIANILGDFAQGVFSMKGLAESIASDEGTLALKRLLVMDQCRSSVRSIPIDAESESFDRHATPVSGLPELFDRVMQRLSAAFRMPVTLLFGQSPGGLNSTGESDLAFWYQRVGAMQETELRTAVERLVEVAFRAANGPTNGREPEGWAVTFNPLDRPTAEQKAKTRKTTAETDAMYIDTGVLDVEEVRQSRFGGETYSDETAIEQDRDTAEPVADPAVGTDPIGQPSAEPATTSETDPVAAPAETLNGAQVKALVDLVTQVSAGALGFDSALEIMLTAFPIGEDRARRILSGSENIAAPTPTPPQFPQSPETTPEDE